MRRHTLLTLLTLLLMYVVWPSSAEARQRLSGWCEDGNSKVVIVGTIGSTLPYQRSYPNCTVTVYLAGTTNLATIFSDNSGTALANPFTATVKGRWFFYADNGRYDVRFSGGGIATPFTIGDFQPNDFAEQTWSYESVTFSATPTFDAALDSIFAMTLTGNVTSSTVSNAKTGRVIGFQLCQDATGSRTFAWPATFLRPPTITAVASACTNATFFYDGTNWRPLAATGDNSVAIGLDILFERISANLVALQTGDTFALDTLQFDRTNRDVQLSRGAANRLDLAAGDTFRLDTLQFDTANGDVQLDRAAANKLRLATGDSFVPQTSGAQSLGSSTELWDLLADAITSGNFNGILIVDGNKYPTIQAAMDACPAGGCLIYIPAGTYTVTALFGPITKSMFLWGAGMSVTTIKIGDNANLNGSLLSSRNHTGVFYMEDLTLDGNRANQASGSVTGVNVRADAANPAPSATILNRVEVKNFINGLALGTTGSGATLKRVRVSNCVLDNNATRHFILGFVDGAIVRDCLIVTPSASPSLEITTLDSVTAVGVTALSDVLVEALRVEGVTPGTQNIIKVSGDAGDTLDNVRILNSYLNMTLSGDVITTSGSPTITRLTVSGNHINSSSDLGIAINGGNDVVISNNTLRNCTNFCINIGNGIVGYVIEGNHIFNDQAATQDGIQAASASTGHNRGVVIGNTIRAGSSGDALKIDAPVTAGSVKVYDNAISQGAITLGVGVVENNTAENCSSSASPAVCSDNSAGSVTIAAAATTKVVNTTQVTANSQIILTRDNSLGTKLSVTCNTQSSLTLGTPYVSARTAGTSFTVAVDVAPTTDPLCISYVIIN